MDINQLFLQNPGSPSKALEGYMQPQNAPQRDDRATLAPRAEELGSHYVGWLDGMRAICSTYVVFHHIYIGTYRQYNTAPYPGLAWLSFGQLAVVAFIVISGYSLALKPLQNQLSLKEGTLGFFRRRAWRILPPYWAALILAMAYHLFIREDLLGSDALRSFLVHAFLLQDVLHNHAPNGAFWSIAVEAQIYILFPFVLAFSRISGVALTVGLLGLSTILIHIATDTVPMLARIDHLSPQLFIAFLIGYLAAWLSRLSLDWSLVISAALIAAIAFIVYLINTPIATIESDYYWEDIAFAIVIGLFFIVFSRGPVAVRHVFGKMELLGSISYSVYLTHLIVLHPILIFTSKDSNILSRLTLMYCLGIPAVLLVGWVFFLLFEKPFLTIRSWSALKRYPQTIFLPPRMPDPTKPM